MLLRLFFQLLGLTLVAVPVGLALTLPQSQPLVAQAADPTPEAVGRARALLKRQDPRRLPVGGRGEVRLTQEDVDLALAALPRRVRARLDLKDKAVQATFELPANPLGPYLNVSTRLAEADGALTPHDLHLGPLALPDALAGWLAGLAWEELLKQPEWGPLAHSVERVSLEDGALTLGYRVPDKLPDHLRTVALSPQQVAALRAYHEAMTRALAAGREPMSLPRLLAPLFQLAGERGGGAEEYRAALLAVGLPLAGHPPATLVPEARNWPPLPRRPVTLAGRIDSAQHFIVSAVIAAYADTPVANVVGLWKELEDSRSGSGFSFADLAADQAGTRVGEVLVGPEGPQLARRLAAGLGEESLVPRLADLPENLGQAAFRARYGGPGDPRYEGLTAEIARRVARLGIGER